jgi:hypothetical protein
MVHTLLATVDRSTEALPQGYTFRGDFAGMMTNGSPVVVALSSSNSRGDVEIPELDRIDWSRRVGFVYGGPDDLRIVRTQVFH